MDVKLKTGLFTFCWEGGMANIIGVFSLFVLIRYFGLTCIVFEVYVVSGCLILSGVLIKSV